MVSITKQTSWEELHVVLSVGDEVPGVVLKHEAFGVFCRYRVQIRWTD